MGWIGVTLAAVSFSMFFWLCYKAAKELPSIKDIYSELKEQ